MITWKPQRNSRHNGHHIYPRNPNVKTSIQWLLSAIIPAISNYNAANGFLCILLSLAKKTL